MKTKRSDAAFPVPGVRFNDDNFIDGVECLTKLEYMATQIMVGMMIAGPGYTHDFRAALAVEQAKRLIEALNEEQP